MYLKRYEFMYMFIKMLQYILNAVQILYFLHTFVMKSYVS